jgi:hypothetical protein
MNMRKIIIVINVVYLPESVNSVTDTLIKVLYPMRLGDIELRKEGEDYYVGHLLGTRLTD